MENQGITGPVPRSLALLPLPPTTLPLPLLSIVSLLEARQGRKHGWRQAEAMGAAD